MHNKNNFKHQFLYSLSLCALLGTPFGTAFTWEDGATLFVGISTGYIVKDDYFKSSPKLSIGTFTGIGIATMFILGEKYPIEQAQIKLLKEQNTPPHVIKREEIALRDKLKKEAGKKIALYACGLVIPYFYGAYITRSTS